MANFNVVEDGENFNVVEESTGKVFGAFGSDSEAAAEELADMLNENDPDNLVVQNLIAKMNG